MPQSGFEPATQWSEAQHATSGLWRLPLSISSSSSFIFHHYIQENQEKVSLHHRCPSSQVPYHGEDGTPFWENIPWSHGVLSSGVPWSRFTFNLMKLQFKNCCLQSFWMYKVYFMIYVYNSYHFTSIYIFNFMELFQNGPKNSYFGWIVVFWIFCIFICHLTFILSVILTWYIVE